MKKESLELIGWLIIFGLGIAGVACLIWFAERNGFVGGLLSIVMGTFFLLAGITIIVIPFKTRKKDDNKLAECWFAYCGFLAVLQGIAFISGGVYQILGMTGIFQDIIEKNGKILGTVAIYSTIPMIIFLILGYFKTREIHAEVKGMTSILNNN